MMMDLKHYTVGSYRLKISILTRIDALSDKSLGAVGGFQKSLLQTLWQRLSWNGIAGSSDLRLWRATSTLPIRLHSLLKFQGKSAGCV
ncbi:MAG: hypothetical protein CM15mV130_040 [Caudoviricetes sp.]|nr:MAG: hypothetical protein CM15mV130_040 [Caudoviricetes sp.]